MRLRRWSGIFCGQTREHSPQSVHLPATWNARMTWNSFSSKLFAAALFSTPDSGLSKTHFSQVHAGHTLRHALQRMQRESSPCQNAKRSSGVIASRLLDLVKAMRIKYLAVLAEQLVIYYMTAALAVFGSARAEASVRGRCKIIHHSVCNDVRSRRPRSALEHARDDDASSYPSSSMPLQGMPTT